MWLAGRSPSAIVARGAIAAAMTETCVSKRLRDSLVGLFTNFPLSGIDTARVGKSLTISW
jgi:hypothetical protein